MALKEIDYKTRKMIYSPDRQFAVQNTITNMKHKKQEEKAREFLKSRGPYDKYAERRGENYIINSDYFINENGEIEFDIEPLEENKEEKAFNIGAARAIKVANFAYECGIKSSLDGERIPDKYLTFEERIVNFFKAHDRFGLASGKNTTEDILYKARYLTITKLFDDIKKTLKKYNIDVETKIFDYIKDYDSNNKDTSYKKMFNSVLQQYALNSVDSNQDNTILQDVLNANMIHSILGSYGEVTFLGMINRVLGEYKRYGVNLSEDEYNEITNDLTNKYNGTFFDKDILTLITYEYQNLGVRIDQNELDRYASKLEKMTSYDEDRYRKFFDLGYGTTKTRSR